MNRRGCGGCKACMACSAVYPRLVRVIMREIAPAEELIDNKSIMPFCLCTEGFFILDSDGKQHGVSSENARIAERRVIRRVCLRILPQFLK